MTIVLDLYVEGNRCKATEELLISLTRPNCQDLRETRRGGSADVLGAHAVLARCRRGQEIYGQGDSAEHGYRIVSGAARRFTIRADGRRQIVDFLLPDDFFGFASRDEHSLAVEAMNAGIVVACYHGRRLEMLAASDLRIRQTVGIATAQEISRLQARILLLGQITALRKVGAFLLEMARRSPRAAAGQIVLPMSRYDIADYLALSVETVSRAMTCLRHRGLITLAGTRRVHIVDSGALGITADGDDFARSGWPPTASPAGRRNETARTE